MYTIVNRTRLVYKKKKMTDICSALNDTNLRCMRVNIVFKLI